jgi:hypothetical protein
VALRCLARPRPTNTRRTPRMRGIQYAAASQFYHWRLWNTGSPAFAGDDSWGWGTHLRDPAARFARVMPLVSHPKKRGRGECRVRAAPAVSCAKAVRKSAHEHTGSAESIRHSLRNGFTAYIALSPATNSSCHRRRRIGGLVEPGWARKDLRRLDTSNGCQDHAVLPYAATRLRQKASPGFGAVRLARRRFAHESKGPALRRRSRPTLPRPPHPVPR